MKSILLILIFSISLISSEKNPDNMSEEELLNEIMNLESKEIEADKRIQNAKEKTKAIKKLGETVDKVAKKLGVED